MKESMVRLERRTTFLPPLHDQTARSTLNYLLQFPKFYSSPDVTKTRASVIEPAVQTHSLSTSLEMKFKAYREHTASQLHKPISKTVYVNIWIVRDANYATHVMRCARKLKRFVMVKQIAFVHVMNITL